MKHNLSKFSLALLLMLFISAPWAKAVVWDFTNEATRTAVLAGWYTKTYTVKAYNAVSDQYSPTYGLGLYSSQSSGWIGYYTETGAENITSNITFSTNATAAGNITCKFYVAPSKEKDTFFSRSDKDTYLRYTKSIDVPANSIQTIEWDLFNIDIAEFSAAAAGGAVCFFEYTINSGTNIVLYVKQIRTVNESGDRCCFRFSEDNNLINNCEYNVDQVYGPLVDRNGKRMNYYGTILSTTCTASHQSLEPSRGPQNRGYSDGYTGQMYKLQIPNGHTQGNRNISMSLYTETDRYFSVYYKKTGPNAGIPTITDADMGTLIGSKTLITKLTTGTISGTIELSGSAEDIYIYTISYDGSGTKKKTYVYLGNLLIEDATAGEWKHSGQAWPESYTATCYVNGGVYQTLTSTPDVTLPDLSGTYGSSFVGWGKNSLSNSATSPVLLSAGKVTPTTNVNYYAYFYYNGVYSTTPCATVTIASNNSGYGTVSPSSVANVPYGTVITNSGNKVTINGTTVTATPATATAQYTYAFSSWTNGSATVAGATTVTANFTRTTRSYTITFKNEDGTTLQSGAWNYGTTPTYGGATPTKASTAQYTYTFKGWSPAITTVTGAATYTAQFTPVLRSYTITFKNEDGTTLQSGAWNYGTTPTYSGATPTKTATAQYTYSFKGWNNTIVAVTGDATYTATYNSTVNNYTITANVGQAGYGSVSSAITVPYGTTITTNNNVLTAGSYSITATPTTASAQYTYDFSNWTDVPASVTGNVTVKANFTRTTNQYTITFKNEDGTTLQTGLVEYGQTPVYSGETPTKASTAQYTYTFDTWSPAIAAVTQAQDYTATYTSTLRSYTVTIESTPTGYGTVDVSSVADVPYGTVITTSDNTIDVNGTTVTATPATTTSQFIYSFDSWTNGTATVQGDLTVFANFSRAANILQISEMATTPDWTAGETRDVQLTRTLITTGYNTLCLPFDVASDELSAFGEGVQLYTLSSVEQTDGVTLNFTSASSIEAGTPYLVEVTSANANPTFTSRTLASTTSPGSTTQGDATFYGAYVQTELQTSDYFLGANNLLYHPIPSDRTIKGLRGYFTINAPAGTPIRVAINQPTNIVSPSLSGEGRGEATKIIKDNQLLIIRDGKTYNALGVQL